MSTYTPDTVMLFRPSKSDCDRLLGKQQVHARAQTVHLWHYQVKLYQWVHYTKHNWVFSCKPHETTPKVGIRYHWMCYHSQETCRSFFVHTDLCSLIPTAETCASKQPVECQPAQPSCALRVPVFFRGKCSSSDAESIHFWGNGPIIDYAHIRTCTAAFQEVLVLLFGR